MAGEGGRGRGFGIKILDGTKIILSGWFRGSEKGFCLLVNQPGRGASHFVNSTLHEVPNLRSGKLN